jgi:malate dehydrogenase
VISQPLSLLCKISPLIDELSLYDIVNTPGVTADLSLISSVAVSCSEIPTAIYETEGLQKITGYLPDNDGLKHALTGADVCIIPAGIPRRFPLFPNLQRWTAF